MEHIFVLIGVALVLFFAVLLLTAKKYKSVPNTYLAISLLILALLILKIGGLLENTLLDTLFDFFRIEYLFSFLLYLYVSASLTETIKRSTYLALLSPFLLFSALYSIVSIADLFAYDIFGNLLEQIEPFEIYFIIAFNMLLVLLFTNKVQKSDSKKSFKNWIYIVSIGLTLVLISFFVLEIIELIFDQYYSSYILTTISLFFIFISYFGVQQVQVEQELQTIKRMRSDKNRSSHKPKNNAVLNHFERIQLLMEEEELYKDPNLDREALASKLGLSSSSITRILKTEGQVSFSDYINQHRINLAKEMLRDERFDIFSLEAIGREVGFKSRSSFYQSFKKEVGVSPGMFKKQ